MSADSSPAPNDRTPAAARDAILAWYDATRPDLAFRAAAAPCAVLVAERLAQQTQAGPADTGLP